GDAPRLRRAAARLVRRVAVEDLGDLAEAAARQVRAQPVEEAWRHAAAHALAGVGVDAEQVGPHPALVIGGVARPRVPDRAAAIAVAARARAQPHRRDQLALAYAEDPLGALGVDERRAQPERVELIGPQRRVAAMAVDDVVEPAVLLVPER